MEYKTEFGCDDCLKKASEEKVSPPVEEIIMKHAGSIKSQEGYIFDRYVCPTCHEEKRVLSPVDCARIANESARWLRKMGVIAGGKEQDYAAGIIVNVLRTDQPYK